jgi:hypothetical protein
MPRSAARSSAGNRPGYRSRRDGRAGNSGATRSHRSSGTRSADTQQVLPTEHPTAKPHSELHSERSVSGAGFLQRTARRSAMSAHRRRHLERHDAARGRDLRCAGTQGAVRVADDAEGVPVTRRVLIPSERSPTAAVTAGTSTWKSACVDSPRATGSDGFASGPVAASLNLFQPDGWLGWQPGRWA